MAQYGDVKTPKFYINLFDYIVGNYKVGTPYIRNMTFEDETEGMSSEYEWDLQYNNDLISASSFYHRNPIRWDVKMSTTSVDIVYPFLESIPLEIFRDCTFVAILGHNLFSSNTKVKFMMKTTYGNFKDFSLVNAKSNRTSIDDSKWLYVDGEDGGDGWAMAENTNGVFNEDSLELEAEDVDDEGNIIEEERIESFIVRFMNKDAESDDDGEYDQFEDTIPANTNITFCGIAFGKVYEMPHSPELDLSVSYNFDGMNKSQSSGGSTLVDYKYLRPPNFGDMPYFEHTGPKLKYIPGRSGRKVYNLGFKYLANSDMFPEHNQVYNTQSETNLNIDDTGLYNKNQNFFTDIVHLTEGGARPFIFQEDSESSKNHVYSICTFNNSTFSFQQVAIGLYDISMELVESW
tara:strand:- start:3318 stop:4529 length:1212 start_codon:yes stop_codon:yes gene_type:complete